MKASKKINYKVIGDYIDELDAEIKTFNASTDFGSKQIEGRNITKKLLVNFINEFKPESEVQKQFPLWGTVDESIVDWLDAIGAINY